MRYIVTEEKNIALSKIEQGLKQTDLNYSIAEDSCLKWGNELYGVLDITLPNSELFDEEIEELKEDIKGAKGKNKKKVLVVLNNAKAIVALQVLHQGREIEETLEKIDPLWEWFFQNYEGLLQADSEGFIIKVLKYSKYE